MSDQEISEAHVSFLCAEMAYRFDNSYELRCIKPSLCVREHPDGDVVGVELWEDDLGFCVIREMKVEDFWKMLLDGSCDTKNSIVHEFVGEYHRTLGSLIGR